MPRILNHKGEAEPFSRGSRLARRMTLPSLDVLVASRRLADGCLRCGALTAQIRAHGLPEAASSLVQNLKRFKSNKAADAYCRTLRARQFIV